MIGGVVLRQYRCFRAEDPLTKMRKRHQCKESEMAKVYEINPKSNIRSNQTPPDDQASDILDCLSEGGACSLNVIVVETHLEEEEVRKILSDLMRQGIVIKRDESGLTLDRV